MPKGFFRDIPSDGLGFDVGPWLEIAKTGVQTYGDVQAIRRGPTPIPQPAAAPVVQTQYVTAPSGGARSSNGMRYLVLSLAALGGGLILYRAIKRRR